MISDYVTHMQSNTNTAIDDISLETPCQPPICHAKSRCRHLECRYCRNDRRVVECFMMFHNVLQVFHDVLLVVHDV